MARPRVITLGEGKISLNGFPKEVTDQLEAHILGFGKEAISAEVKAVLDEPMKKAIAISTGDMPDRALAVRHNKEEKTYDVVILKYNALTKEAVVDVVKPVGEYKQLATNEFKKKVIEFGFL